MKKNEEKVILGITAFNHDSSATLIFKNRIIAFSEEERFNHLKHTGEFPIESVRFCFNRAHISIDDVTDVAFYFNIYRCFGNYFKHLNPIYFFIDPSIFRRKRFYYELVWLLNFKNKINSIKRVLDSQKIRIHFIGHHLSHVWYGYFASRFRNCIVLSNDSVGESISSLAVKFNNRNDLISTEEIIRQEDPHSLGYLYGAITEFLGYKRGDGEGKVMALASFGTDKYIEYFNKHIKYLPHGRFRIGKGLILRRNFQPKGQRLSNNFYKMFGKARKFTENFNQKHYDIAFALQYVAKKIVEHQLKFLSDKTENIVLTGGVAQNSAVNGCIVNKFRNKNIFIPPIPNDAGCSLGAALYLHYKLNKKLPKYTETSLLGPDFNNSSILNFLMRNKISYKILKNPIQFIVKELLDNKVIALFKGRTECGPRALGNRSIIASPISGKMKDHLNKRVKFREFFRPYGGFILKKYVKEVFEYKNNNVHGPYMSFVFPVKREWQKVIPALVHIDGTSRVQIIKPDQDDFLENLLEAFCQKTKIPILINTSLNLKGYPISATPQDAVKTFYCSAIDYLLFNNNILISK